MMCDSVRLQVTSTRRDRQVGQAIVMVSIGTLFLMGIMGLVIDVGWGYYRKQVAQAAADSAALAAIVAAGTGTITCGSNNVVCQSSTSCSSASAGTNIKAGCQYGAINGIASTNISLAANTTSPYNGVTVNYWVTATVAEPFAPTFLRTMGFSSATVGASATGASVGTAGGGNGCMYALDPTAGQAFNMNGSSVTTGCGVVVNSNNTTNAVFGNGSSLSVGSATLNMVTGAGLFCNGCGSMPTPVRGVAAADPLASVPAPTYSGCNQTNYSYNGSTGTTLNPGVYCGGIRMNGSGAITFNPGTYILNGGGLSINGTEAVTANGVLFYNTSNGYTAGPLLLNGSGSQTITPETSGSFQGIIFYQDHNICPSTSHTVNGGSNLLYTGTIYLHCTSSTYVAQKILYNGVENPSYYQGLVVDLIQFNGAANLYKDPTGGKNIGIGLGAAAPFLIQ
jgi:Flp pilus assembly protein TadG